MYLSIVRGFKAALACALVLTPALATTSPAVAQPAYTYHCVAEVSTALQPPIAGQSGGAVLSVFVVSGATLHEAVGKCHQGARDAFTNNPAWSNPTTFCARYSQAAYEHTLGNTARTRVVWVTDYFQEMGHTNGYNRVGGYSVVCNGPLSIVQVDPTAALVPTRL
ncbi:MAG TPA: hypothetical protein VHS78_03535 [Candidatus Elarobacter sp.]|jgi:hypothetical protein|nr:hypothetical protein [Candidatus Elarobacter sp.]